MIIEPLTALDFADLPYWDLCAALRTAGQITVWAGDPATEQRVRAGHRWSSSRPSPGWPGTGRP